MASPDVELIKLFISCAHSEIKMRGMSKFVADDFYFNSQQKGKLNFDAYCKHEGEISYNCYIETLEVIDDDEGLRANVIHHILDNVANFHADLRVTLHFEIKNSIIQNIASKYKASDEIKNYIDNVFKPITK